MTFYARFPHPPTKQDCKLLTEGIGLWESIGGIFPVGYATLRSQDSRFIDCRAWSLDIGSDAVFISGPFDREGAIPPFSSAHLPTSLAPLIYWNTDPPRPTMRGRTYMVGLTEQFNRFVGDTEYINDLYGDALVTSAEEIKGFFADAGAEQVLVSSQQGGRRLDPMPSYPVVSATNGDRLMGGQRRRTRHGR